jgi:hypothetical protein
LKELHNQQENRIEFLKGSYLTTGYRWGVALVAGSAGMQA